MESGAANSSANKQLRKRQLLWKVAAALPKKASMAAVLADSAGGECDTDDDDNVPSSCSDGGWRAAYAITPGLMGLKFDVEPGGKGRPAILIADASLPQAVRDGINEGIAKCREAAVAARNFRHPAKRRVDGDYACGAGAPALLVPSTGSKEHSTYPAVDEHRDLPRPGCLKPKGWLTGLRVTGEDELDALHSKQASACRLWSRRVEAETRQLKVVDVGGKGNVFPFPVVFTGDAGFMTGAEQEVLYKRVVEPHAWKQHRRNMGLLPYNKVLGIVRGEPGGGGELVLIWVRDALSQLALMGRRAGPQLNHCRRWRGWMKVCGASGTARLDNIRNAVKNTCAVWGWGGGQMVPGDIHSVHVHGTSTRAAYGVSGMSFQLGNLLWRHPSPVKEMERDPLARVYMHEVQLVYDTHVRHMLINRPLATTPTVEEMAEGVSFHLEHLMANEMGQHESHLALHRDRPTIIPSALTGGNARLDGEGEYTRGSFLLADGAVEVPYGERDVVLVWPEYMHAVIPPIAVSRIPARRMSYLHYTRRGRTSCPVVGKCVGDATPEQAAGWRRAVFGMREGGRRTRSGHV